MDIKRIPAFGAIYLLWGGAYLAISVLVHVLPPFLVAGIRYSLAAALLFPVILVCNHPTPSWRQLLNTVWTGVAMLTVGYGVVFWAEQRLSSWLVGVLASTTFLWTYLGESLVLRSYKFRGTMMLPLVIGIAGMPLLVGFNSRHDHVSAPAVIAVLLGAISWAAGSLAVKKIDMPRSYVQTAGIQLAASGLLMLLLSAVLGEWTRLPAIAGVLTWRTVLTMMYLVIAASVVAFSAFHWLLAREPASLVATSTYVNPMVAMVLGIAAAHERASPMQLVGAFAILSSIVMVWFMQKSTNPFEIHELEVMPDLQGITSDRN
jgi:drug/metabolite transporter (DMT)-like permease